MCVPSSPLIAVDRNPSPITNIPFLLLNVPECLSRSRESVRSSLLVTASPPPIYPSSDRVAAFLSLFDLPYEVVYKVAIRYHYL